MIKKIIGFILACAMALTLASCSNNSSNSDTNQGSNNVSTDTSASEEIKNLISSDDNIDVTQMFTDRDKEIGYNESECKQINLSDSSVTITDEGSYILSGSISNGQIIVDADKSAKIQLILNGVSINCDTSAAIYVKSADKVFITLANSSENTLSNKSDFVAIDDNNIDAVVFSKEDITFNGLGTLTINANYGHGIVSKDDLVFTSGNYNITSAEHGVTGKDSIRIADGTFKINSQKDSFHCENTDDTALGFIYIAGGNFDITAQYDGFDSSSLLRIDDGTYKIITGGSSANASTKSNGEFNPTWGNWSQQTTSTTDTASNSAKGLKATAQINLNGGTFVIDSSDDSIHSNGNVNINNGNYTIDSGDDGVHADAKVIINGGFITINKSYEGIEGKSIDITGGEINLTSSDDGFNAAGGADQSAANGRPGMGSFSSDGSVYLNISGGKINVNAKGDGLDSNGSLTISGGETYVSGPTDNGNGALDYDSEATITGGILVAVGSSGMAQNMGSSSTQGSILLTSQSSQQASSDIIVKDSSGNVIVSYTSPKQYNCIVVSTPRIVKGEKYEVTMGTYSQTIEMTNLIYGSGGQMGGGPMGGGKPGR